MTLMQGAAACSIANCGKRHHARGYCKTHHERWRRHGDPHVTLSKMPPKGALREYLRDFAFTYNGDCCLIWPYARDANGYARIGDKLVSRIVCRETHGAPPSGRNIAAHSCGKGHEGCISKSHLSWKTQAGNMADAIAHGTTTRGERQPTSKLTTADVRQIRSLRGTALQREIAARFNVSRRTVCDILAGKRWGWL